MTKRLTGAQFKKARLKAGINVSALSRAWGVSRITLHAWESGRKPIPYARGEAIIAAAREVTR